MVTNDLVNVSVKTQTTEKVQVRVSEHALLKFLKIDKAQVRNVRAFVRIGGGGDYSNMDLDLNEVDLIVEYETISIAEKTRVIAT